MLPLAGCRDQCGVTLGVDNQDHLKAAGPHYMYHTLQCTRIMLPGCPHADDNMVLASGVDTEDNA